MEKQFSLPFKESNLKYIKEYDFDNSVSLKILNKYDSYFLILERWFIFDTEDKSMIKDLGYIKRHAYLILNKSKCYFCCK